MDAKAQEILDFWLGEIGEKGWYEPPEGIDDTIRARFEPAWHAACAGASEGWRTAAGSCLALLLLLDQFPRNMFRGSRQSFASDAKALAVAKWAIARGIDRKVAPPERQFFYLPLMHSEAVADQSRSVRLFVLHMNDGEKLLHARAHRAVIRRFGRFPYRNPVLGRRTTPPEAAWLEGGGYQSALAEIGG